MRSQGFKKAGGCCAGEQLAYLEMSHLALFAIQQQQQQKE